jgi:hypothetical protein
MTTAHDTSRVQRAPQGPAPASGEEAPHPELGTAQLPEDAAASIGQRWNRIQAEFVDDPRKAVSDAHGLVGELIDQIVERIASERTNLGQQWSAGEPISTEDLRVCLQRYRAFFSRLVPQLTQPHRA